MLSIEWRVRIAGERERYVAHQYTRQRTQVRTAQHLSSHCVICRIIVGLTNIIKLSIVFDRSPVSLFELVIA